jgi:predicted nucleotide-binding protein (sugar kinase/HSP70/actin superfamily)
MDKGIQVVMPPMINFFIQTFVNTQFNHLNHIENASIVNRKTRDFLRQIIEKKVGQVNNAMTKFRHSLEPLILPRSLANKAEKVLCLSNQAGEGWLLPGEIVAMAESGIRNIISLQPFGCIANHVVAKGISTKLGRLFPDLNILNLDMDAGNSDANIQNRLDFFIHSAKSYDDSHSLVP